MSDLQLSKKEYKELSHYRAFSSDAKLRIALHHLSLSKGSLWHSFRAYSYLAHLLDLMDQRALIIVVSLHRLSSEYRLPKLFLSRLRGQCEDIALEGFATAQFAAGLIAWESGPYSRMFNRAIDWWSLAMKQGCATSTQIMARCYKWGIGVTQDKDKADELLQQAMEFRVQGKNKRLLKLNRAEHFYCELSSLIHYRD